MKLTIMVGLPGSGKSTLAKKLAADVIISTDSIFESSGGSSGGSKGDRPLYLFVGELIGQAHKINQAKVRVAMSMGLDIIVDNTNLAEWERQPYLDLAKEFGYEVEIAQPSTEWANDPEECFKRNSHGVPLEVIKNMLKKKDI